MFIAIPTVILVVGVIMFFVANMKMVGGVTAAVGLTLMGAVNIPYFSPAISWVNGLF